MTKEFVVEFLLSIAGSPFLLFSFKNRSKWEDFMLAGLPLHHQNLDREGTAFLHDIPRVRQLQHVESSTIHWQLTNSVLNDLWLANHLHLNLFHLRQLRSVLALASQHSDAFAFMH